MNVRTQSVCTDTLQKQNICSTTVPIIWDLITRFYLTGVNVIRLDDLSSVTNVTIKSHLLNALKYFKYDDDMLIY